MKKLSVAAALVFAAACGTNVTSSDSSQSTSGTGGAVTGASSGHTGSTSTSTSTASVSSSESSSESASSSGTGGSGGGPLKASDCFKNLHVAAGPNYDQFNPVIGSHCNGTNHQDIQGVEKLVFLGDSVTEGTPPNLPTQYYRFLIQQELEKKFGPLEVADCAAWGARNDDFLIGKNEIGKCFPSGVEQKKTLTIFTMGGNDIANWAKNKLDVNAATMEADASIALLHDAVVWLKDPAHFPNGSYVVYANVYEYTDGTGDLNSCPAAALAGFSGNWIQGAPAVIHFQEQYMKLAVDTQTDMIFLLENFCGHGYHNDDPASPCYRGPNTPRWFDLTCIHPNPDGHQQIADYFVDVVNE